MRQYRYYNNILWGDRYNPETKAHHVDAEDFNALRSAIPPSTDSESIQVFHCGRWRWASEIAEHNGGFARSWHGERI